MRSNSSNRLWVGPLMLVVIIALIYLLSLMPNTPPSMGRNEIIINDGNTEYAMKGQMHVDWEEIRYRENSKRIEQAGLDPTTTICQHDGIANETDGTCICSRWYTGSKCHIPICMNNGFYNQTIGRCVCSHNWVGEHCNFRCTLGVINKNTGTCECVLGRPCTLKCINGQMHEGHCICFDGFTGPACTICDGSVTSIQCDDILRKRGAVNSRLTLSGLSFCIITIGVLCVGAKRRRSQMSPMTDDTWYRVFHPNNNRPIRCRHDYMCGGSWVPRDRALIVAPGRVSMSTAATPRIHRLATPPPSYTSVNNLNSDAQQPPTYEEATRIEIETEVNENNAAIEEESQKDEISQHDETNNGDDGSAGN